MGTVPLLQCLSSTPPSELLWELGGQGVDTTRHA